MKTLVIDRAKWLRGEMAWADDTNTSKLLTNAGRMCCLGFLGRECGIGENDLRNKPTPSSTPHTTKWPDWILREYRNDSSVTDKLVRINDDPKLAPREREKRIKAIFREHGWTVKFVGRTPRQ